MRYTAALVLMLGACLDTHEAGTDPSCEEVVCAYAPDCAAFTTGTWDMRSERACLETFACGERPDDCEAAMLALPCFSKQPTWEEVEAHTRALEAARAACL